MAAVSRLLLPVAATAAIVAGDVRAATVTGSLAVRVVVQPSCAVTGATLDFGTYASGQAADLEATARIGYTNCSAGTLRFDLNAGINGTVTARRAANGTGAFLDYALFQDGAGARNFGEGAAGQTITLAAAGSGNVTVHGRVPKDQMIPAGTYTDLVIITLNF